MERLCHCSQSPPSAPVGSALLPAPTSHPIIPLTLTFGGCVPRHLTQGLGVPDHQLLQCVAKGVGVGGASVPGARPLCATIPLGSVPPGLWARGEASHHPPGDLAWRRGRHTLSRTGLPSSVNCPAGGTCTWTVQQGGLCTRGGGMAGHTAVHRGWRWGGKEATPPPELEPRSMPGRSPPHWRSGTAAAPAAVPAGSRRWHPV